ncbi:alpha/beta-hydrolase [Decorospora gaudefroyi]|uniref:Alpha/beta-hydrolase n=1 Tax=Decorospora gaudefroyi TaxID=184978 RepID=A0A6A5K3K8_9PLEO|nr:alpha/beta-hydrolase [Decorospora gaudefroyi]
MESLNPHDITLKNGETTHYYEGGSKDGTPLIFLHGWPDISETWKHQLSKFSATPTYRVIAPDMRGYGGSSAPKAKEAYRLQVLVEELVDFAKQVGVTKAVWIGHDWGCGVTSALAAHYPELCIGLANLSVPYRSLELGLDFLTTMVNRDIYPKDEYEWGQWEYMRYYELHPEETVKTFEGSLETITKILYANSDPTQGWWFGGHPENLPDIPIESTVIDQELFSHLIDSHKKHGFFPPTAYYLNHPANVEYAKSEKNGGVLEFPVLFIDAKYDSVCSPSTAPKMAESQKAFAKNLTYVTVEAGHWLHLERPEETNGALERWLKTL